jgi:hypothetical protein
MYTVTVQTAPKPVRAALSQAELTFGSAVASAFLELIGTKLHFVIEQLNLTLDHETSRGFAITYEAKLAITGYGELRATSRIPCDSPAEDPRIAAGKILAHLQEAMALERTAQDRRAEALSDTLRQLHQPAAIRPWS